MPPHATTPMGNDLTRGNRLELPWFAGKGIELGRRHRIKTPVNEFIYVALKPYIHGATACACDAGSARPPPLKPTCANLQPPLTKARRPVWVRLSGLRSCAIVRPCLPSQSMSDALRARVAS